MTTFCPALPSSRATALPRPREDPVTRQTLASSATMRRVVDVVDEKEGRLTKASAAAIKQRAWSKNFMVVMME